MREACPECSDQWMLSDFEDCYPIYDTYEEYGCYKQCNSYQQEFQNKSLFTPKDFNYYLLMEQRDRHLKSYYENENVNGNSWFYDYKNGFQLYADFEAAGKYFAEPYTRTVETVSMAKH